MFNSVSSRLTLWYVGALAVVLVAVSVGVYLVLARSLYDRMDGQLRATLQAATALKDEAQGHEPETLNKALQVLSFHGQTIAVVDGSGRVLAQKQGPGGKPLRLPPSRLIPSDSVQFYQLPESRPDVDDSCRGAFRRVTAGRTSRYYTVVVMQSLEPIEDKLDWLWDILCILVPTSLVPAGVGGRFLARGSLAPVMAMAQRAQRISAENLDQRLPIANPRDELGRLAAAFNELLARLNSSFAQQRQFMADASHELRTPLAAILTTSSVLLQRDDRDKSEYIEALTIVEQQARRLTRIVEDMFILARADAGPPALRVTEFYLDELLAETARGAAALAAEKKLQLEVPALPEAPFRGDEGLLRQMTWNLLDNAIKYTPECGKVRLNLESPNGQYVVTVTDTGVGIPPEAQSQIFQRFYRADKARPHGNAPDWGGAGLGLPIARWIAEAHGGRLELQRSDTTGSTFVISLPHS